MKKLLCAMLVLIVSTAFGGDVTRRGIPIPAGASHVPLASILAKPGDFTTQPVVTEGVVSKVCWIQGCWMNVAPASGKASMHVTFRNFTVPRNSSGQRVRLLGTVRLKDAKPSVVATGVELGP